MAAADGGCHCHSVVSFVLGSVDSVVSASASMIVQYELRAAGGIVFRLTSLLEVAARLDRCGQTLEGGSTMVQVHRVNQAPRSMCLWAMGSSVMWWPYSPCRGAASSACGLHAGSPCTCG